MAERTLRGARLGGQSFEDERGIEFAARQQAGYRCPQDHVFDITMAVEADVPAVWESAQDPTDGPRHSAMQVLREPDPPVHGKLASAVGTGPRRFRPAQRPMGSSMDAIEV